MSCTTCTKTLPIPYCSGVLILGAVNITEGKVLITDVVTGRMRIYPAIIEMGILSVRLTSFVSPNLSYTIQAIDASVNNYGTEVPITIDGVAYDCLDLNVDKLVNVETDVIEGAEEIQIKIYEPTT